VTAARDEEDRQLRAYCRRSRTPLAYAMACGAVVFSGAGAAAGT